MQWNVNIAEIARIWKGGENFHRWAILDKVQAAFEKKADIKNLMLDLGILCDT